MKRPAEFTCFAFALASFFRVFGSLLCFAGFAEFVSVVSFRSPGLFFGGAFFPTSRGADFVAGWESFSGFAGCLGSSGRCQPKR